MKKIVSLVLVLSMVLSMFSFVSASSLKDITGTKYEAAVDALMELGVVSGYPDGTYLPNNVVTRAELAKLLVTAYGLEQAAEVAKGTTAFSDVPAEHWAAGYINVASDYKFVNGYPDGTFKPDATVTYAEAITMALRVLGYANEVDSKGTWPTNYIAKAQDLKLMKDLTYASYNDGAQRGNVALLIWNMLRTPMWEIQGESQGDGLMSAPDREMLNVKFSDYRYVKDAKFAAYSIDADSKKDEAKVTVTFENVEGEYEYKANDFYTFVPGTEVEILINVEDSILLTIVPTSDNKLVEGTKLDLDKTYDELDGTDYDYAYARIESKHIAEASVLKSESIYVDKIEESKNGKSITINSTETMKYDDYDDDIFLKDGERVTLKDLKKGDILTKVNVSYLDDVADEFYVIGGSKDEGKLTKHITRTYDDSDIDYVEVTIGGKVYKLDRKATYVVDPSKKTITAVDFVGVNNKKMNGEVVTFYLDPIFGNLVRVEFDGKIDGGEETTTVGFYGLTSEVSFASKDYSITLLNEKVDNEDVTFADSTTGKGFYTGADLKGTFAAVELDDDDEIVDITPIARAQEAAPGYDYVGDGSIVDGDDTYNYELVEGAKYDKKAIYKGNEKVMSVDEDVVVFVASYDKDSKKDKFKIEVKEGLDVAKKVKDDDIIIVYQDGVKIPTIKCIVVFDNITDKSEYKIGVVQSWKNNNIGTKTIELDSEDDSLNDNDMEVTLDKYDVVVYNTKAGKNDNPDEFKIHSWVVDIEDDGFDYITIDPDDPSLSERKVLLNGNPFELDDEKTSDKYEDDMIILVHVSYDDDDLQVDSAVEIDYEDIAFVDGDRFYRDAANEITYIITGMELRAE